MEYKAKALDQGIVVSLDLVSFMKRNLQFSSSCPGLLLALVGDASRLERSLVHEGHTGSQIL